jgi:hypothetical protein
MHIEMIEAKVFRTFIRVHSLLKRERLSANIKLTLQKTLINSIITYACSAWEFAADSHLLNLKRHKNNVFAPLVMFKAHRFCIRLLKQNYASSKQKYNKIMRKKTFVRGTGEARELRRGQAYDVQVTKLPLQTNLCKVKHDLLCKVWTTRVLVHIAYITNISYFARICQIVNITWYIQFWQGLTSSTKGDRVCVKVRPHYSCSCWCSPGFCSSGDSSGFYLCS